jgi:hypothetical protein
MFVHSVYFWLKPDLTADEKAACMSKMNALGTIDSVKQCIIGPPADTDRPVIDRTYSYALIVIFEDKAGHDAYQVDPIHDVFRDDCAAYWDRVQIYDAQG